MLATPLPEWLTRPSTTDGLIELSPSRFFAHDETSYDAQYESDPGNVRVGHGVCAIVRRFEGDISHPALEIGCGTGLVSLGLVERSPYPLVVLTDPSPAFLRITRKKLSRIRQGAANVAYAVLSGDALDRIPAQSLSLIVLRSTLHHLIDVDGFLAQVGRVLVRGGLLVMQEPCMEGYVLMGAMIQFLPALARAAGRPLSPQGEAKVAEFRDTMVFYARRDIDKSFAEDKHLFRVDELMGVGRASDLDVAFLANSTLEEAAGAPRRAPGFTEFFREYAKYCLSWPEDALACFDEHLAPYCAAVEAASGGASGPYMHGVFVAKKQ